MANKTALTIRFTWTKPNVHIPQDKACPSGYAGPPAPEDDNDGNNPNQPKPPEPPRRQVTVSLTTQGGSNGRRTVTSDQGLRAALTVDFSRGGRDDKPPDQDCQEWANHICWRPSPFAYLNLGVTDVRYDGQWEMDEALPTLSGVYNPEAKTITLNELEGGGEEGESIKPSIRVMWPAGDLSKYLDLVDYGESWYDVLYRFRGEKLPGPKTPEFWVTGPHISGDSKTALGDPEYAWRIPVQFTLTEGLLDPGSTSGAVAWELYQDLTSPEDAFQPTSGDNGALIVAEEEKDGKKQGPGVDFNESGLNKWLQEREEGDLEGTEYTLLMEVLPAYGGFSLKGKYLCDGNPYDLQGEHLLSREPPLFNGPLVIKPVAYLKITPLDYIIINYFWDNTGGQDLDTRTKLLEPIEGPEKFVGFDREDNFQSYMSWADDNMEVGYESVVIYADELRKNFGFTDIVVSLNAFWWCQPTTGNITIIVQTYSGGTIEVSNHKWINQDGRLLEEKEFPTSVDYERCEQWSFDCQCANIDDQGSSLNPEWDTGEYGTTNGSFLGKLTVTPAGKIEFGQ